MALAVYRLDSISRAIHKTYASLADAEPGPDSSAYSHFRARAYRLLTHYVDHDLQEAFRWLLMMRGAAPKKTRITLHENPFHWGLLAMTAAAGTFMSPNKLRILGAEMKRAHADDVLEAEFENFIRGHRKRERERAVAELEDAIRRGVLVLERPHAPHRRRPASRGRPGRRRR